MRGKTPPGRLLPRSPVPGAAPRRSLCSPAPPQPRPGPLSPPRGTAAAGGGAALPRPRRQRDTQLFCPRRLRKAGGKKASNPRSSPPWPCDAQPRRRSLLKTGVLSLFLETPLEMSRLRQRFPCLLLRRLGGGALLPVLPGASEAARGTLPAPSAPASPLLIPAVARSSGVCLPQVSSPSTREKDCSCPKYHSEGSVSLLSPSGTWVPQSPLHAPAKQQIRLHPCLV